MRQSPNRVTPLARTGDVYRGAVVAPKPPTVQPVTRSGERKMNSTTQSFLWLSHDNQFRSQRPNLRQEFVEQLISDRAYYLGLITLERNVDLVLVAHLLLPFVVGSGFYHVHVDVTMLCHPSVYRPAK